MAEKILEFLINAGYIGIIIAGLSEALFLPFPMEVIFLPVALVNPSKALKYAVLLITASFLGSMIAYAVGKFGGQKLLCKYSLINRNFGKVESLYNKNAFLTIITSSFTPIPYEVYTLTAGMFNVNFKKFILASIISRLIRYIPQGILIFLYGDAVLALFKRYALIYTLILFLIVLLMRCIYFQIIKIENKKRR